MTHLLDAAFPFEVILLINPASPFPEMVLLFIARPRPLPPTMLDGVSMYWVHWRLPSPLNIDLELLLQYTVRTVVLQKAVKIICYKGRYILFYAYLSIYKVLCYKRGHLLHCTGIHQKQYKLVA